MARNEMVEKFNAIEAAIEEIKSALENCDDEEDRGFLLFGLNRLERQKQNMGTPGQRNCSPLIGAQIGPYKICSFMSRMFFREVLGFPDAYVSMMSSSSSPMKTILTRRTLEANESKPTSTTQYVYMLLYASDATLGNYQSAFSICKKMMVIPKSAKPGRLTRRLTQHGESKITYVEYAERVLANLLELGAAEVSNGLYRLI